jgi:hypothetical protein
MALYNNIKEITKKKKIPIMKLESYCGFSQGSVCKWNDISPSVGKVKKVADYLNVKVDKLLQE